MFRFKSSVDEFKVLGIVIDNKLKKLKKNFDVIYDRVEKKIGLWATYGLTFKGRITVAKSLLLSQYTYAATILDSNDKTLTDKIQSQLDYFIFQNKRGSAENPNFKKWVRKDLYHGKNTDGGFSMINVRIFFQSIRFSLLRRYAFGTGPANIDPPHWRTTGVIFWMAFLVLNPTSICQS